MFLPDSFHRPQCIVVVERGGEEEALGKYGVERDTREGDAAEKEDEEVPPPIVSLYDLHEAAMEVGREERGTELVPWTRTTVGEVA